MRKSRTRMAAWAAVAALLAILSLAGAVGASARDGRGSDDGGQAAQVRGHEQESEAARQEDRGKGEDQDAAPLLRAALAPTVPTDPTIAGTAPGGLPWVLERGSVLLQGDGRLRLVVKGLVIPVAHGTFPAGTARPVTTVSASVFCAATGGHTRSATSAAVPISEQGDATIDETLALPATCFAPFVLVHPNGGTAAYIAVDGRR
jgi:hypothetical protein